MHTRCYLYLHFSAHVQNERVVPRAVVTFTSHLRPCERGCRISRALSRSSSKSDELRRLCAESLDRRSRRVACRACLHIGQELCRASHVPKHSRWKTCSSEHGRLMRAAPLMKGLVQMTHSRVAQLSEEYTIVGSSSIAFAAMGGWDGNCCLAAFDE